MTNLQIINIKILNFFKYKLKFFNKALNFYYELT